MLNPRLCDAEHRIMAKQLLRSIGFDTVDASYEDDINGLADIHILSGEQKVLPVGLKKRGANSGSDFNLSVCSKARGDLGEYAHAGGKLYLYWMKEEHVLVQLPDQNFLNSLLPDR